MFNREDTEPTGLLAIENLRLWAEYMPECCIKRLNESGHRDEMFKDRYIIIEIEKLYEKIKEIYGEGPYIDNIDYLENEISNSNNKYLKDLVFELSKKFNLIRYRSFDLYNYSRIEEGYYSMVYYLPKFAKAKLTDEELSYCNSLVLNCCEDNSEEIAKEVQNIDNFFLKSYAKYLLIHDRNSKYYNSISSSCNRMSDELLKQIKERKILSKKKRNI